MRGLRNRTVTLKNHSVNDPVGFRAGLEAMRAYLNCDAVAKGEAALRQKYIGSPRAFL